MSPAPDRSSTLDIGKSLSLEFQLKKCFIAAHSVHVIYRGTCKVLETSVWHSAKIWQLLFSLPGWKAQFKNILFIFIWIALSRKIDSAFTWGWGQRPHSEALVFTPKGASGLSSLKNWTGKAAVAPFPAMLSSPFFWARRALFLWLYLSSIIYTKTF